VIVPRANTNRFADLKAEPIGVAVLNTFSFRDAGEAVAHTVGLIDNAMQVLVLSPT